MKRYVSFADQGETAPGRPAHFAIEIDRWQHGPIVRWLREGPEDVDPATIAFDWYDGTMRVLLWDKDKFEVAPLILSFNAGGCIIDIDDSGDPK